MNDLNLEAVRSQPGGFVTSQTKQASAPYEAKYIGVLDGIRAVAVLVIVWFHLWQQSWLQPVVGEVINLDWLPRHGAIMVDMMILLSGFCLFLPYARHMVYGEANPTAGSFYRKRIARIMPSYYIILLVTLLCFALPLGEYGGDMGAMFKDLLPHLFFVHNWFEASNQATHLNGVLWTVGVLMQFYIVFPLLAKAFQKKPWITYWSMTALGLLVSLLISKNHMSIDMGKYVNNTFTFVSVYANGMMGAYAYVSMTKNKDKTKGAAILATFTSVAMIWVYKIMCDHRGGYGDAMEQKWQVDYRYLLSLVFLIFIISTIFACDWYKKIWDNKGMKFLAAISFNLYMVHQYIAVKLKEFKIPSWQGGNDGWMTDHGWAWGFFILSLALSLIVATLLTFFVEKPLAKLILGKRKD